MNVLERLVGIYAPHACLGCDREGSLLCDSCKLSLMTPAPQCYRCSVESPAGRTCQACRRESGLVSINAAAHYEAVAKELVWKLKFERAQAAADIMGRRLALLYGKALQPDVLIVPVPTATSRVRKRGYDQAELIARSLAKHAGRTYRPLLMRLGKQEQIGAGRQQRHDQLQGVFTIRQPERVGNARIMLIDDVLTTGATMEEAAATLRLAGAKAVGALVFARV